MFGGIKMKHEHHKQQHSKEKSKRMQAEKFIIECIQEGLISEKEVEQFVNYRKY